MSNEKYINMLIQSFKIFDESDNKFLNQLLTLVNKHLERKGRH